MGADAPAKKSFFKVVVGGFLGLCAGAGTMYFNAFFNSVVRVPKPVANFSAAADGLTVTCKNLSTGTAGWWDFGDGSPLEEYAPDQPTVTHEYAKPGAYSVKLTVRNFLMEENDRTVGVETTAPTAVAALAGQQTPKLLNIKVEPVGTDRPQVPAAYIVSGEVQNADELVWAVGETKEHVAVQGGKIEKMVRFDKEGSHPIVLTALAKSKATPDVFVASATVGKAQPNVFDVRAEVTDVVSRSVARTWDETIPFAVRDPKGQGTGGFTKVVPAGPNVVIKAAAFDPKKMKNANVVKDVRTEIAKDGRSFTVTGQWANADPAVIEKMAGGGNVFVPVSVTEERSSQSSPGRGSTAGVLDTSGQGVLRLPAPPPGGKRTVSVGVGYTQKDGSRVAVANGTLDGSGTWTAPLPQIGPGYSVTATTVGNELRVRIAQTSAAAPPPAAGKPAPPPAKK